MRVMDNRRAGTFPCLTPQLSSKRERVTCDGSPDLRAAFWLAVAVASRCRWPVRKSSENRLPGKRPGARFHSGTKMEPHAYAHNQEPA